MRSYVRDIASVLVLFTNCILVLFATPAWGLGEPQDLIRFDLSHPEYANWFQFSRGVVTVDPQGDRVDAQEPRFRVERSINGIWGDPELVSPLLVGADVSEDIMLIAGGRDRDDDGDAVLLTTTQSGRRLHVTTYSGEASQTTSRALLEIHSAGGAQLKIGDIRTDLVDVGGYAIDQFGYQPMTGTVCLGTIVVLCRTYHYTPQAGWFVAGVSIFYSIDNGTTFVKYFDDTEAPLGSRQPGINRVHTWSMQGWFAPWASQGNSNVRPEEAVVAFTDYRFTPYNDDCSDPSVSTFPTGGRACFFKLKPSSSGVYVPLSTPSGPAVGVFELNTNAFSDPTHDTLNNNCPSGPFRNAQLTYSHLHAIGVTEYGDGNDPNRPWQLLVGVGDGGSNSIIRIIVADTSDNAYWRPATEFGANWEVQYDWHGTIDSSVLDRQSWPTVRASDSSIGFFFVGTAPGPERGTLLLGLDTIGESGMLVRPSATPSFDKTFTPLFPSSGPQFTGGVMFQFRTDAPHRERRTVVCDHRLSSGVSSELPRNLPGTNTISFSRESGKPGTWGFIPLQPIRADRTDSYKDNVFVVGDHVYLVQADLYNPTGTRAFAQRVVRRELPALLTDLTPLQVGPGGTQLLAESAKILHECGPGVRIGQETSINGIKRFNSIPLSGGSGSLLEEHPPMISGSMMRLARSRTLLPLPSESGQTQFGHLYPTQRLTDPMISYFSTPAPRVLTFRAWMRNSTNLIDSPQRNSNPVRSDSSTSLVVALSNKSVPIGTVISAEEWYCIVGTVQGYFGGSIGSNIESISLRPGPVPYRNDGTPGWVFDPQLLVDADCYFGLSEFIEGDQDLGYPLPPRPQTGPVMYPPELADIALSEESQLVGEGDFTVYFAGLTPEDAWDTTPVPAGGSSPIQFPLFSVVTADESEAWITVSASPRGAKSTPTKSPELVVTVGGHQGEPISGTLGPTTFLRGRTLIGVLVYDSTAQTLRVSAALSGQRLPDLEFGDINFSDKIFRFIRLGDHFAGAHRRVGAFQWVGFSLEHRAISSEQTVYAMQKLNFIEPTSRCAVDFNGDSAVDFFDYLDFVDAFASSLPASDFNQDGVVDFFDYLSFVDAFSLGCQ